MEKFRFCFKNYGTHQNVLVLFHSFQICFAFVLKNSGTHQNVLVLILSFQTTQKRPDFVLQGSGTHQNVMILFQSFWTTQKRSTSFFGTHQNVLVSFRQLASITERLCFRFGIVDITIHNSYQSSTLVHLTLLDPTVWEEGYLYLYVLLPPFQPQLIIYGIT